LARGEVITPKGIIKFLFIPKCNISIYISINFCFEVNIIRLANAAADKRLMLRSMILSAVAFIFIYMRGKSGIS